MKSRNYRRIISVALVIFGVFGIAAVQDVEAEVIVCFPLDTDPGWSTEGQWAFGVPLGGGSHCGDPTSGYTGTNVYGYNLAGDYMDGIPEYYLTTTALDCSGFENVMLSFWRWLGVESASFDHAKVDVSNDGSNWTIVWEHTGSSFCDGAWIECEYDISSVADDQGAVYIRWTMGPTDGSVTYPGWNIDDICFLGDVLDDLAVTPAEDMVSSGYEGGPFTPSNKIYTLTNIGPNTLDWTAGITELWVDVSPNGGTLNPGDFNTVEVSFNADANALLAGDYNDTVTFTNTTSGATQTRDVTLEVLPFPAEIDVNDSIAPEDDLNMPFGDVIVGLPRTEYITITNLDPEHDLIVTDISLKGGYFEDFNDGQAQGWEEDVDDDWNVVSGEYIAYQASPAGTDSMVATYSGFEWSDCYYEVKIRRSAVGFARYMLVRATSDFDLYPTESGSGYGFGVDESSFLIFKLVDGATTILEGWTNTPYLNPPEQWNTLGVNIVGTTLEFYINGNLVWSGSDSSLCEGRIGLLGFTNSGVVTTHYFDDAVVIEPLTISQAVSAEQQWYNEHPYKGGSPQTAPRDWAVTEYPGKSNGAQQVRLAGPAKLVGAFRLENVPELPATIPPGDSTTFDVVFEPTEVGGYESVVVIKSNDEDEPEVEVQLSGTGIPDYLEIVPEEELEFSGHPGGPFVPSKASYQLTNNSSVEVISWSVGWTVPWLDIDPNGGILDPCESAIVTVKLNSTAETLPEGDYNDTLIFTDITTTVEHARGVILTVFTAPKIWIDPAEGGLSATVWQGETTTKLLTIGNSGDAKLTFTLSSREVFANRTKTATPVAEIESTEKTMILEYEFSKPVIIKDGEYDVVKIKGLEPYQRTGAPIVPVRPVKILVPYGKKVVDSHVTVIEEYDLSGTYQLPPAQRPYPLSYQGVIEATEPDPTIYAQSTPWPGTYHEYVSTQSKRGYGLFIANLLPLQYVPATGAISYVTKLRLEIELADTLRRDVLVPSYATKAELRAAVDNPSALGDYPAKKIPVTKLDSASISLPPGGPYQYVVITNEVLAAAPGPWNFQVLCDSKTIRGIPATVVTTEWICANYDGTRPDGGTDNQTRIRNFLIDAYQNWDTEYVLLGGTNSIVPARMFWVDSYAGEVDTMPVDMYYGCVEPADCTFDYDADGLYGEPTDGVSGGDVDLYAEIYVGRAAVEDAAELENFIQKTLTYDSTQSEYLSRIAMLGEWLGFGGPAEYAKDSMEQIRLGGDYDGYFTYGFENHIQANFIDFNTIGCLPEEPSCCWPLYDKDAEWPKEDLICLMNGGIHIFNHLGHAGYTYDMKLYTSDLTSLTNTDYFFAYSQGCMPGGFDTTNCFAEVITSMERGAYAAVMNARYGWGAFNSTDGPSHRFDRQFWDAPLGEGILELGRANQDSKEDNLWDINGPCIRWCYYELNLFGDPEQQLRFSQGCDWLDTIPDAGTVDPNDSNNVDVVFEPGDLPPGTYEAEITISSNDQYEPVINVPVTMTVEPDILVVTPDVEFEFSGARSGPFTPASHTYTLTNNGTSSLNWTAGSSEPWLDVDDPNSGILGPSDSNTVEIFLNANADALEVGEYSATVTFTNVNSGIAHTRKVTLTVTAPDYFTELFDAGDNDLVNQTLTFIPDESGSFYAVCRKTTTDFPTDPNGGTTISLEDDDYEEVILSGDEAVCFYGQSFNSFYIGSNGYVTFETGDTQYFESLENHFQFMRISALFDDLSPNVGGAVTWRQLDDRVVVTFEDVPEFNTSNSNSFQIEMFFDGTISITHLGISATDGLAGFSQGSGIPPDFEESDLSAYNECRIPGDFDTDGDVDSVDLGFLISHWLDVDCTSHDWCEGTDLNENTIVDFADFAIFADNWLVE